MGVRSHVAELKVSKFLNISRRHTHSMPAHAGNDGDEASKNLMSDKLKYDLHKLLSAREIPSVFSPRRFAFIASLPDALMVETKDTRLKRICCRARFSLARSLDLSLLFPKQMT